MEKQSMEATSLNLLFDSHQELSGTLNSLGGKTGRDAAEDYKFWSSSYMGHASQGYIYLRKASGMAESRFLIRPAIEMMIRLEAIRQKPELIYQIGYTETQVDDRIWLRALSKRTGEQFDEVQYDKRWEKFKNECRAQFPSAKLIDAKLTVKDVAVAAGLGDFYDSIYRTYCRYTHAALRAIVGDLNDTVGPEDNLIMAGCVLCAVESLISIGGAAPNLDSLRGRREALVKEKITDQSS